MTKKVKNPAVKPAIPEVVFDDIWVSHATVEATNPNGKVRVVLVLKKATVTGGRRELASDFKATLVIDDLFKLLQANPALAAVVDIVLDAIIDLAEEKELI